MRVTYTTADSQAVGFYRISGPAEILAARGEIEIVHVDELKVEAKHGPSGPVIVGVEKIETDVLILQRLTNKNLVDAIPFYQDAGIAVVVDLDDDLERLDPAHAQYQFNHPRFNPNDNWQHLKRACRMADFLTVSTDGLRRYGASHGRVEVLRNCVPESYLHIESKRDGRTVGWGGTVHSHPNDLRVTHGGVAAAVAENGARFMVVGDGWEAKEQLGLDRLDYVTGIVPIADYPALVSQFDVGIAPLQNNAFNRCKSSLKLVEMAALGVPFAASDMPEYRQFCDDWSSDLLVDRNRRWRVVVTDLLRDNGFRVEAIAAGRERVRERFVMEDQAYRWLEAWESAVDQRAAVA